MALLRFNPTRVISRSKHAIVFGCELEEAESAGWQRSALSDSQEPKVIWYSPDGDVATSGYPKTVAEAALALQETAHGNTGIYAPSIAYMDTSGVDDFLSVGDNIVSGYTLSTGDASGNLTQFLYSGDVHVDISTMSGWTGLIAARTELYSIPADAIRGNFVELHGTFNVLGRHLEDGGTLNSSANWVAVHYEGDRTILEYGSTPDVDANLIVERMNIIHRDVPNGLNSLTIDGIGSPMLISESGGHTSMDYKIGSTSTTMDVTNHVGKMNILVPYVMSKNQDVGDQVEQFAETELIVRVSELPFIESAKTNKIYELPDASGWKLNSTRDAFFLVYSPDSRIALRSGDAVDLGADPPQHAEAVLLDDLGALAVGTADGGFQLFYPARNSIPFGLSIREENSGTYTESTNTNLLDLTSMYVRFWPSSMPGSEARNLALLAEANVPVAVDRFVYILEDIGVAQQMHEQIFSPNPLGGISGDDISKTAIFMSNEEAMKSEWVGLEYLYYTGFTMTLSSVDKPEIIVDGTNIAGVEVLGISAYTRTGLTYSASANTHPLRFKVINSVSPAGSSYEYTRSLVLNMSKCTGVQIHCDHAESNFDVHSLAVGMSHCDSCMYLIYPYNCRMMATIESSTDIIFSANLHGDASDYGSSLQISNSKGTVTVNVESGSNQRFDMVSISEGSDIYISSSSTIRKGTTVFSVYASSMHANMTEVEDGSVQLRGYRGSTVYITTNRDFSVIRASNGSTVGGSDTSTAKITVSDSITASYGAQVFVASTSPATRAATTGAIIHEI